ncbi:MAG: lipoate--protein ligase family protein [Chloroflexi bacterium]|nr:lipoate--protein ligase family protein [Chloroflexota bacterium]
MDQWRLIEHGAASGAHNMAIDQAILESVIARSTPPTLRFYAWTPYCLSLGYGQRAREVDLERLKAHGFSLVRRPTGGGAVLHADELTYSIAIPDDHPLAEGGILESYRQLSAGLIAALSALGIDPRADRKTAGPTAPHLWGVPACFETTSDYEITCNGRKLVGSAQMRRSGGILQHGSLPIGGDIAQICEVLCYDSESARQVAKEAVRQHATTLTEVTGAVPPDRATLASLFSQSLESVYRVDLVPASLSAQEKERAAVLADQVYGSSSWTFRR